LPQACDRHSGWGQSPTPIAIEGAVFMTLTDNISDIKASDSDKI
jgi:hypothetical protein